MTLAKHDLNQPGQCHPAFQWVRSEQIESLNIRVDQYQHIKTGALHYHIDADNNENVFLVALRTIPTDSTGVAHILEHTALCGSEKYPVRDPFFMMIRRSLNTFMNAFTSSDWTAYPFASQNRKDFNNLLDVYLDAVFFSRLHELDFAQEGHRLEFAEQGNTNSELEYKGVVYNEMKGAMSSPVSSLWQTMSKYLFPTTTYHFNSGGEPADIPDLSYQQLKEFYRVHYHPSNAVFMTYGDILARQHQEKFEDQVLSRFEPLEKVISVHDEKHYFSPLSIEESYALDAEEDATNKTHLVMGWLLGHSINLEEQLEAQFLSSVLLENSASPLMQALETTDLGCAPSPLCGLEDSNREMSFLCGLEGSSPENAQAFEQLALDVLERVAREGVAREQLEAVLHQLELSQREIGGDHYPFGLQLILSGLPAAIHRGDVIGAMNLDPALEKLREKVKDPDYIKDLIKTQLLDNPHQVKLTFKPDQQLEQRRVIAEKAHLAQLNAAMNETEKQSIVEVTKRLEKRQQEKDDDEVLPKVTVNDVPEKLNLPESISDTIDHLKITHFNQGTNGLVYQEIVLDLPELTAEEHQLLPLLSYCFGEVGSADKDYLQMQIWQSSVSGGIGAHASMRGKIDNEQQVNGFFIVSGKALKRNHAELAKLLEQSLCEMRFDEHERIRELISQLRTRKENSVTGSGHSLAMQAAASGMSPVAKLSHLNRGLASIVYIKELDEHLNDESDEMIVELADKLQQIHTKLLAAPRQYLLVCEEESYSSCAEDIKKIWQVKENKHIGEASLNLDETREQVKQAWLTSTQVNFCARAYPTVTVEHSDAAALTVLGGFLRNGFLHRAIREQGGAYGGGANQDLMNACFKFFSYRDPRMAGTLNDFDASIQWLLDEDHDYQPLEEAILGVISTLDKPGSPAGDAKQTFHNELFGRDEAQQQAFRKRILKVTLADLKAVASKYFSKDKASTAVISSHAHAQECEALGLTAHSL